MTIRVGPTEPNPTHHVKLRDRTGTEIGLILCNDYGDPAPLWNKTPIDRTALKTASGNSTYADYQYPYSPITQDDWSGGRGNPDIERDSTRYFDGYMVNTRHTNKVLLGPQEFYSHGYGAIDYNAPGEVRALLQASTFGVNAGTFTAHATYTTASIWLKIKAPAINYGMTVKIKSVNELITYGTANVTSAATIEGLMTWTMIPITASLIAGTTYHIVLQSTGTQWSYLSENNVCSFVILPVPVDDTVIYFEYKVQQYKVLSGASGAPKVWMNGDRGVADSNAGNLNKLIDATKAWAVNEWAGAVVKVILGTGKMERTKHRTIISNTATQLICDSNWTIQHDTTTQYVILGSNKWTEVTGHGLTAPVTAVQEAKYLCYFAQGDAANIVTYWGTQSAGAWLDSWRVETANNATHLAYQPLANKLWRSQNSDATKLVSVSSATPVAYGTDLPFSAVIIVGDTYKFINGLQVYPNDSGVEALWVYKEEIPYIVTTTAEPIKLSEMKAGYSMKNGAANLVWGVYSFFSFGNGLQRYYGGSLEDLGPNIEEGLPKDRQGPIIQLIGYPGRIFAVVDADSNGYSSLLERSGSGWHEIYRAPLGQKLKGASLQVIPGSAIDRLWLYQGNISIWLPIASDATSEYNDVNYKFCYGGALTLSRMHAGMFDTQKLVKNIKIWNSEIRLTNSFGGLYLSLDYKLDDDDTWTVALEGQEILPPMENVDMTSLYGIAGKRIQLRIRFTSLLPSASPVLLAVITEAVMRNQIKYMYNLTFRVMDDEPTLAAREVDDASITAAGKSAMTKLAQLEAWSDADTDSMLYMTANSPLYDGRYIFLNPPATRQAAANPDPTMEWTKDSFVCSATAQEA